MSDDEDRAGPSVPREQGEEPDVEANGGAKPKRKLGSSKKLDKLKKEYEKRGVVYLSRLPPHIKPQKLRHMLEQHAELGRMYLAPEDESARRKRKKQGGNSGRNFTEGWVEFEDKGDAKRVAASLNGQPMGGRRRSAHYYDLWTIKYLPKFKWDHLTEEINYQRAVKDQRMAAEVSAAKRERDFYLSRVDKAKGVEAIIERKKRARSGEGGGSGGAETTVGAGGSGSGGGGQGKAAPVLRTYGQRQAKADPVTDANAPVLSSRMLQLIAGQGKG